jgi:hypothetical protein
MLTVRGPSVPDADDAILAEVDSRTVFVAGSSVPDELTLRGGCSFSLKGGSCSFKCSCCLVVGSATPTGGILRKSGSYATLFVTYFFLSAAEGRRIRRQRLGLPLRNISSIHFAREAVVLGMFKVLSQHLLLKISWLDHTP